MWSATCVHCCLIPASVSGGHCLIVLLTASAFDTHEYAHIFKFPPLDKLRCVHFIYPCRCLNPSSALVSSGGSRIPGRRFCTMSLHTWLDSGQGRGQASGLRQQSGAVNDSQSWQTDRCCPQSAQWIYIWILFVSVCLCCLHFRNH